MWFQCFLPLDYLLVDKFSSYEILSSSKTSRLRLAYESRMKKIGLITYEHILSPLCLLSKVKDLVLVKGNVKFVLLYYVFLFLWYYIILYLFVYLFASFCHTFWGYINISFQECSFDPNWKSHTGGICCW